MEVGPHILRLVEYGPPRLVREADWESLQIEEAVQVLESCRILTHSVDSGVHMLTPSGYVGTFVLPGRRISIRPRFPRLYDDLRRWLASNARRLVRLMAGLQEAPEPEEVDPAAAFVKTLASAVDAGLPVTYESVRLRTSSPRGRLLLADTVLDYHVKGLHHLAVCSVPVKTTPRHLVSVIRAAADLALRSTSLDRDMLAALDLHMSLFDAGDRPDVGEWDRLAEALREQYADNRELTVLLDAAIALFREEALLDPFHRRAMGGTAHFHKMERLWELALVTAFTQIGLPQGLHPAFHPYGKKSCRLFSSGGPDIDPDVVLFADDRPAAVVDAKYSIANRASSRDVYQITCYVERLGASSGLLVYLTEGDAWIRRIGETRSEASIFEAGIPVTNAVASLRETLMAYCSQVPDLRTARVV